MKKATKIAIGAAALVTAGAMAFAAPSFAGSAISMIQSATVAGGGGFDHHEGAPHATRGAHIEAELAATVTGVADTVTDTREAAHGGYWEAFELDATATTLPAVKPTEGGFRLGIHPQRAEDGTSVEPSLESGVLTGTVEIHVGEANTTKVFALYPSDGGEAVLVTVTVDADGVATATASGDLSVAYSADVAAAGPAHGETGFGRGHHDGGHGHGDGRGHGSRGSEDGSGFTPTEPTTSEVTPNA